VSTGATAPTQSHLAATHSRLIRTIAAISFADPIAACDALQSAYTWLDDRAMYDFRCPFVPPMEWIADLAAAAAIAAENGARAKGWRLMMDLVYHEVFGVMHSMPASLHVRIQSSRC
jgi:hypothetical protein